MIDDEDNDDSNRAEGTYVVTEVGIHDDDEITGGMFYPVYVRSAQSKLFFPRAKHDFIRSV